MENKRVLLKLSGESLKGNNTSGIDFDKVLNFAKQIKSCIDKKAQIAVVIGGGNFWRGRSNTMMDRTTSDNIGMLATSMNALALNDALLQMNQKSIVQTSITMSPIAEPYDHTKAIKYLEDGYVVIFGCGTGHPFFSTDTAASLRAAEINADVILKATNVDGVYTKDPKLDIAAKKIDKLTYFDIITNKLNVIDNTSASLCMNTNIPTIVFDANIEGNIEKAIFENNIGTIIDNR